MQQSSKVHILVFKGAHSQFDQEIDSQSSFALRKHLYAGDNKTVDDSYPFKKMNETIGILWDNNMSKEQYKLFVEL
jgi:hypothetical protein